MFGLSSQNPVMKGITDYLVDEGNLEDELLGMLSNPALFIFKCLLLIFTRKCFYLIHIQSNLRAKFLCEGHICVQYVEVNASFHILIITQPYTMIT